MFSKIDLSCIKYKLSPITSFTMPQEFKPEFLQLIIYGFSLCNGGNGGLTMCAWLLIVDLDECTSGQHNCHEHAVCSNNIGSFTCHCLMGYTGDGLSCEGIPWVVYFT